MKFWIPALFLFSGCGVSLTTSGFKAGLIDEITRIEGDSKVHTEDIVGLSIQWAPYFSWNDIKNLFKKERESKWTPSF